MGIKQKAEEKKMSMSKNIARLAVTAGLTAALSFGGVMAPVTMAFAAEGDDTITITQNENNGATKFKAYQIFKADVVDKDGQKVASNVDWASDQARDAVRGVLTSENAPGITNSSTAQEVADYLSEAIMDTTPTAVVKKDDLLNKIALAVEKDVPATGVGFDAGTPFTATSKGYYLFLTDTDSLNKKEKQTGTSPIFAVVGGDAVSVTEKTSIPTVTKKIKDDATSVGWADKADFQMGQTVQYKLTGTVANNVDTFGTYYYEFYDEPSAGLTVDESSVKAVIGETPITPTSVTVSPDSNGKMVLSVKFDDLKAAAGAAGVTVDENTRVVVTYSAKLDPKKSQHVVVGGTGNSNTVKLIYSNNPGHDTKGESVSDTVRDYTYALRLVKKDATDENMALTGVRFTICATTPDDTGSKDKYVQGDGSLGAMPYEFTTTDSGEINVKGLDAGTYTVKETHTLAGYNTIPDFTFNIKATGLDNAEGVGENKLTVKTSTMGSNLVKVDTTNTDNGTVVLIVKNKQGTGLPLTGLNGVTFTWIAGGAVLCIGVAHLIRSRKQAEESEQE